MEKLYTSKEFDGAIETSFIDVDVMLTLLCLHEDEKVGKLCSLKEEFSAVCAMATTFAYEQRLYLAVHFPETRDPYRERGLLLRAAELSETEKTQLQRRMLRRLEVVTKKLLWLNRISRQLVGEGFIRGFVDTRNASECRDLISDLMDAYQIEKETLGEDFLTA